MGIIEISMYQNCVSCNLKKKVIWFILIFIQVAVIGHSLADRFSTADDKFKPDLCGADEAVQSKSGVIESADQCGAIQADQCEKVCIEDSLKKINIG